MTQVVETLGYDRIASLKRWKADRDAAAVARSSARGSKGMSSS